MSIGIWLVLHWPIHCQLDYKLTNRLPIQKLSSPRGPNLYSTEKLIWRAGNRSFPFIKGKQPITGPRVEFIQLDYKLTNPLPIAKDSLYIQFIQLDFILTNPLPIRKRTGNRSFPFIKGKQPITGTWVEFIQLDNKLTNPLSIEKIVFAYNSYNWTLYWPINCQLKNIVILYQFISII